MWQKYGLGYILGIFSEKHLVTLLMSQNICRSLFVSNIEKNIGERM
jgi:hypothetical protein